jgi:hypothetical protein
MCPMLARTLLAAGLLAVWTAPVDALCIYRGVDNAKTSVSQEFRDARWVVRARVISADHHWSDTDASWTLYRLRLVQAYKGRLPRQFTFLTERNSGGFYMEKSRGSPDRDRDYLLFLVPDGWSKPGRPAARQALWVNYNCGQSKPWTEVTADEAAALRILSRAR